MANPPINPNILVINESTVLSDADVKAAVPALQKQVTAHFYPVWGIHATLTFLAKDKPRPKGSWWLSVLDDADQAGALGYHDLTPDGLPIGKVFAGTDMKYGNSWTVTTSHELLEMLADPDIDLTVFIQDSNTTGRMYSYEVCDACEADSYGYKINGVLLSDFVYPSWFEWFHKPGSVQFDYQKKIKKPFELLPGGYIGIFDVTSGTGWQEVTAEKGKPSVQMRGNVGSRRERRGLLRDDWVHSESPVKIRKNASLYLARITKMAANIHR